MLYLLLGAVFSCWHRGRRHEKKVDIFKLLLLLESAVVLYTTYEGFALARLAVGYGYLGTLPWVAATVSAAWGPTAHRWALLQQGKGGENTAGGIVFEAACGEQGAADRTATDGRRTDEGAGAQAADKSFYGQKSIVTITLTITFCVLECCGSLSQDYMTIYTAVIGFYFGTQSKKDEDV